MITHTYGEAKQALESFISHYYGENRVERYKNAIERNARWFDGKRSRSVSSWNRKVAQCVAQIIYCYSDGD